MGSIASSSPQVGSAPEGERPHVDPSVPILYLTGDADTELKPAQASCFFGRLAEDGAAPVERVYPGEDHHSLVPRSMSLVGSTSVARARVRVLCVDGAPGLACA